MVREPREKKESLKKREAKGGTAASALAAAASAHGASASRRAGGTPDRHLTPGAKRGGATGGAGGGAYTMPTVLGPLRYKLEPPRSSDYDPPRPLLFTLHHSTQGPDGQDVKFYDIAEP